MKIPGRDWQVQIQEDGRSGRVLYREPAGSFDGYWEFGGGDTVASIEVGDESTWRRERAWGYARRAEILERVAREVIRLRAPTCHAEIDLQSGWIHLKLGSAPSAPPILPGPPAPPVLTPPTFLRVSSNKSKLVTFAALAIFAGALLLWGARQAFSIRVPHGTPEEGSVRTPEGIATLIQTLEPYVPSLQGNAGKERYRLSVLLSPFEPGNAGRLIPLASHLTAQETHGTRLLGSDGRTLWFTVSDIGGIDLTSRRQVGPADLRAANPGLPDRWNDSRWFSFGRYLQLTLMDRTLLEFDPVSLRATPVPRDRASTDSWPPPRLETFLSVGVRPTPESWIGLHSPEEAADHYQVGSRLFRGDQHRSAKVQRRIYRGRLGPEEDQERGSREILSLAPVAEDGYLDAAFVRSGSGLAPLALPGNAGYLMVFTTSPSLGGTLSVARVDPEGKVSWKIDTGIDRFKWSEILPDPTHPAFIGTRPPVPGKVPEPILVIVDTRPGTASTRTLWR